MPGNPQCTELAKEDRHIGGSLGAWGWWSRALRGTREGPEPGRSRACLLAFAVTALPSWEASRGLAQC